ncbi:LemA family protein [Kiloniella laminariae]|uniref:LemA family protein n=1 Tax=Kiloniella laminariae TaxID=454162 RepID=A0ABT4LE78_9PROT|nr:LemA family protein [Kiloniella laminariae]MCZ4279398.1 LemA family protein [Kiloniella laminariae]
MTEYILLGLVVIAALYAIMTYNKLVSGRNSVENAWRQIDVQLKRRIDLIPNLVETVKGFMAHEKAVLTEVTEARARAASAGSRSEAIESNNLLSNATANLLAVMENYPDIKSQGNVRNLTEELTTTENKVAFARQHYNDVATEQNNQVQQFPSNIFANIFKFKMEDLWELDDVTRNYLQDAPTVSF